MPKSTAVRGLAWAVPSAVAVGTSVGHAAARSAGRTACWRSEGGGTGSAAGRWVVARRRRVQTLRMAGVTTATTSASSGSGAASRVPGRDVVAAVGSTEAAVAVPMPLTPERQAAVQSMLEAAKRHEEAGECQAAAGVLERVLELDEHCGKAWMLLARQSIRQQDYAQARNVLVRAVRANPTNVLLLNAWGSVERTLKNYDRARKLFARSLMTDAAHAPTYDAWGNMEAALLNFARAAELFRRGLQGAPRSVRLLRALAVLEDKCGHPEVARQLLERALQVEPHNSHVQLACAMLEFKQGQTTAARDRFAVALRDNKGDTQAWLCWAQMEESLDHVDVARKIYHRALGLEQQQHPERSSNRRRQRPAPGAVQLWQALARLEEKQWRYDEAADVYELAAERYPKDVKLLCEWSRLEERRGNIIQARELLRQATRVNRHDPQSYRYLGNLEVRQNEVEAARSLFAQGAEACSMARATSQHDQQLAALFHAWATLEWKQHNETGARNLYERAIKANRHVGWLWLSYAQFEADVGQLDRARHYYARAVNAEPDSDIAWREWGEFERAAGHEDRAHFYFHRAQELTLREAVRSIDPVRPVARKWS